MSHFIPPNSTPPSADDGSGGDNDNALAELIVRYLNDRATEAEVKTLGRMLDGNGQRQALFVRLARLHGLMSEWGRLMAAERDEQVWNLLDDSRESRPVTEPKGLSLDDAVVQPALNEADLAAFEQNDVIRPPIAVEISPAVRSNGRRRWWIAAAAVVVGAGLIFTLVPGRGRDLASNESKPVFPKPVPARPAAVITASAAAVLGHASDAPFDATLKSGQIVDLQAGAIEVTFDSGAVIAVTAPARFRIINRNAMLLESGSLAAHVPPSGIGFRVDGADMTVIDQGTDFGLRPNEKGAATELHVFQGAVDVTTGPQAASTTQPAVGQKVRVTAGNAVVCSAASGGALAETTYSPGSFVRHIDEYRMSIDLHGTAENVPFKSVDPSWALVATPGAVNEPRPVYAIEMRPSHFFPASKKSKWISTGPEASTAPSGKFTFRTTLELPDFAPGTATVTGTWGVDDKLLDVIVNGVSTAEANAGRIEGVTRIQPSTWAIRGAKWQPGKNQVDVVVWNNPVPAGVENLTALNASFAATFAPPVERAREGAAGTGKSTSAATAAVGTK
jgi:hypothetical protein